MDGADMSRETCGYWVFVRRQKKDTNYEEAASPADLTVAMEYQLY